MTYAVKEVFASVQGEGFHAGTPCVFVRFNACNLWSGREADRARDAERNNVACPRWCDTDFAGGDLMTADEVVEAVVVAWKGASGSIEKLPLVVFTGGEPALQLDATLLEGMDHFYPLTVFAIETNGTRMLAPHVEERLWVTVSPKVACASLHQRRGDELKIVVPAYSPLEYRALWPFFTHRFVQPCAQQQLFDHAAHRHAVDFASRYPTFRVSTQTHKAGGLR